MQTLFKTVLTKVKEFYYFNCEQFETMFTVLQLYPKSHQIHGNSNFLKSRTVFEKI